MNKLIASILFCSLLSLAKAQVLPSEIANLKEQLAKAGHDSTRLRLLESLATGYRFSIVDSSLYYNGLAIELAEKMKLPEKKANLQSLKGATILEAGDIPGSLQLQFIALKESERLKDSSTRGFALNRIGNTYMELGEYKKAN
ncbi:MAG TPA: hypothetical protein VLJ68_04350, partial [Chitinophagaceae bacterium]|nr:hypothetical protein [Chitinophagaceae bacterium]